MSVIFSDDFEGEATLTPKWDTSGFADVDTTAGYAYAGTGYCRITNTFGPTKAFSSQASVHAQTYFYGYGLFLEFTSATYPGSIEGEIAINTNGGVDYYDYLYYNHLLVSSANGVVPAGVYNKLDVYVTYAAAGRLLVYVNDTKVIDFTGDTRGVQGANTAGVILLGNGNSVPYSRHDNFSLETWDGTPPARPALSPGGATISLVGGTPTVQKSVGLAPLPGVITLVGGLPSVIKIPYTPAFPTRGGEFGGWRLSGRLLEDLEVAHKEWRSALPDQAREVIQYDSRTCIIWPPTPATVRVVFEYPVQLEFVNDFSKVPLPTWAQYSAKYYICQRALMRPGPANDPTRSLRYRKKWELAKADLRQIWAQHQPYRYRKLKPGGHYEMDIIKPPVAYTQSPTLTTVKLRYTTEVPTATANPLVYTLSVAPTAMRLFVNGVPQTSLVDYTLVGATITFVVAPPPGATLIAWVYNP